MNPCPICGDPLHGALIDYLDRAVVVYTDQGIAAVHRTPCFELARAAGALS